MYSFAVSAAPAPQLKNIEHLVVYQSPNTSNQNIIEFKDFILEQSGKEITLNNGIKINVPINETSIRPVVNREDWSSRVSAPSSASIVNNNYVIKLNSDFCFNDESEMNTNYSIKNKPNYITLFALSTDNGVLVPAFLITIAIKLDISGQSGNFSLWVEALCSDQSKQFIGGSTLLRLVLALCKMFNGTDNFKFVNSYLEALRGVEPTYIKHGYESTTDFKPDYSTTALKRKISQTQSVDSTSERKERKVDKSYVNAELDNVEQENKLVEDLDSQEITWVIDTIGTRTGGASKMSSVSLKGGKSKKRKRRKTMRKRKSRKSRNNRFK